MKRKTILVAILLFTFAITLTAQKKKHNIVFQFTNAVDTLQQKAFVKQLENIMEVWPTANYEVVIYNFGIELVLNTNNIYYTRLLNLKNKGIKFVVCENTLKNRNLQKEKLHLDIVDFVPAGIAEIVMKQEKGWSYIKGGF